MLCLSSWFLHLCFLPPRSRSLWCHALCLLACLLAPWFVSLRLLRPWFRFLWVRSLCLLAACSRPPWLRSDFLLFVPLLSDSLPLKCLGFLNYLAPACFLLACSQVCFSLFSCSSISLSAMSCIGLSSIEGDVIGLSCNGLTCIGFSWVDADVTWWSQNESSDTPKGNEMWWCDVLWSVVMSNDVELTSNDVTCIALGIIV